jgi:hypothetical protein
MIWKILKALWKIRMLCSLKWYFKRSRSRRDRHCCIRNPARARHSSTCYPKSKSSDVSWVPYLSRSQFPTNPLLIGTKFLTKLAISGGSDLSVFATVSRHFRAGLILQNWRTKNYARVHTLIPSYNNSFIVFLQTLNVNCGSFCI